MSNNNINDNNNHSSHLKLIMPVSHTHTLTHTLTHTISFIIYGATVPESFMPDPTHNPNTYH